VTPLELVTAYAPFANGGIGVQPHVITRVRTANGKQLYARRNANNGRVIEPQYVAMMNSMLEQTLQKGGTAEKADLPGWQAAGKTGTSQDWRDAWFIGYTSDLIAGVWLGNDDNEPTKKSSGGNLPVEIWSRFMKAALQGVPVAGLPSGEWRNPDAATPDATAPPPPVSAAIGAPLTINRGGEAVLSAPSGRGSIPAASNAPVPPAAIPNAGASVAPPRDKSLLSKLFGAT
jgi:penicillin-binding protein 1A